MRKFFRTFAGKAILFVLCLVLTCTVIGSTVLMAMLVDADVYTRTPDEVYADVIHYELIKRGDSVLFLCDRNTDGAAPNDWGNLTYLVYRGTELVVASEGASEQAVQERGAYTLYYWGIQDEHDEIYTYIPHARGEVFVASDYGFSCRGHENFTVYFQLRPGLPVNDFYRLSWRLTQLAFTLRYWVYAIAALAFALAVVCFLALLHAAGRRPEDEELHPGVLHAVPFDVMLVVCFLGVLFLAMMIDWLIPWRLSEYLVASACLLTASVAVLALSMSAAVRLRDRSLLRNTVVFRVLRLLRRCVRSSFRLVGRLPLVWRTAVILALWCLCEFLGILATAWDVEMELMLWFLSRLLLVSAALYLALSLRKLQKGGQALAAGNLRYHTDTSGLIWDFARHGENLNAIAQGMNAAVEERMRSERMKTELITNVSHDLKTPLTSVINYAGLIAAEPCENEKITEYAAVLTRQSERLKRLIDDLVEASKAATGNLEVHLAPCDAAVLLTQAAGEYEQRLRAAELTLVTRRPEGPVWIEADGRRMWRLFDNLMNNICKYAQPGTRVYLTLETMSGHAVITFKNTSRNALDISEAELMERFVRGDSARSSEGNGLGLSIARSMAELQGGELRLFIDGDLFKAIAVFPCCGSAPACHPAGEGEEKFYV